MIMIIFMLTINAMPDFTTYVNNIDKQKSQRHVIMTC